MHSYSGFYRLAVVSLIIYPVFKGGLYPYWDSDEPTVIVVPLRTVFFKNIGENLGFLKCADARI